MVKGLGSMTSSIKTHIGLRHTEGYRITHTKQEPEAKLFANMY